MLFFILPTLIKGGAPWIDEKKTISESINAKFIMSTEVLKAEKINFSVPSPYLCEAIKLHAQEKKQIIIFLDISKIINYILYIYL